jgi:cytochrome c2
MAQLRAMAGTTGDTVLIRLITSSLVFLVVTVHVGLSHADEHDAPFVAGFDRFYRVAESLSDTVVGGRLLLSELSCTACHTTADPALAPKLGPNLAAAGKRYQSDWLRRYLADPQAVKPGTTMPDVMHRLDAEQKRQAADAIAAFLSIQETNDPVLVSTASNPIAEEFWRKGDDHRGAELYHSIGCVACHEPDEDSKQVVWPSLMTAGSPSQFAKGRSGFWTVSTTTRRIK